MSEVITISSDEVIHQIKLSCQISSVIRSIVGRKIIANTASEQGINGT